VIDVNSYEAPSENVNHIFRVEQNISCEQVEVMQQNTRVSWWYSTFSLFVFVVVAKNISLGAFIQLEEFLGLPARERGQTTAVTIGWPFELASTYAYTLKIEWVHSWSTAWGTAVYATLDLLLAIVMPFAAANCVGRWCKTSEFKISVCGLLTITALLATLLAEQRQLFWYHDGIGAASAALFQCIDALIVFGLIATWYSLLAGLGNLLNRHARCQTDGSSLM
jgi:hypothetical protein